MSRAGRLSSIFGFLSAAAVLVVFTIAAFTVHGAIDRNATYQQNLRTAHLDRARLLRLQIDEETGVRGYAATRMRVFLQPYDAAVLAFPSVARQLALHLSNLSVSTQALNAELRLNREWLRAVAAPLLRNPLAIDNASIELQGKQFVDQFRAADRSMMAEIDAAADRTEAATARSVNVVLSGAIVIGIVLAFALAWLSFLQRRLGSDLEIQRIAYLEEKHIADALQEAFLQKSLPRLTNADLHAVYVPAGRESRVGGDWYDAFELSGDRILFSIGDVAGHGIEAAVAMSRVRQAILSVGMDDTDPASVLSRVNEILLMQDATMVTAICGFIDLAQGTIRLANAGHPAAIMLFDAERIEKLGSTGPPLGAVDRAAYTVTSVAATPGSLLTLYTDGLVEYGRDWEDGERRLIAALRRIHAQAGDPAVATMQQIFHGEAPPDDVAILTIGFREENGALASDRAATARRVQPILRHDPRVLLAS